MMKIDWDALNGGYPEPLYIVRRYQYAKHDMLANAHRALVASLEGHRALVASLEGFTDDFSWSQSILGPGEPMTEFNPVGEWSC
jgi:hypothetical protein